ncbi:hypothetical protein H206_02871 [Candidatus Electrothrix aarhusensis]|uniref:Uncharacterized protein n=1 Tax=Candidatus Electrothrix aarhusensis TaxID=1859131 RepID=A0A444IR67_9BACT|nr:hypothetical protein H206_02871 [Candidatus Electrothrix aarhusensis]
MQLKQKKNMGKLTAAILLTGCFMLTTANTGMAEGTKIQLDFSKIQQAVNKGTTASGGTAPSAVNTVKSIEEGAIVMGETLRQNFLNSDTMTEMQKKIMADKAAQTPGVSSGQMSTNTVAPTVKSMTSSMQASSAIIDTKDPEMNQVIKNTMGGNIMTTDIMAEMQQKIMAENMGSMQETIQASVLNGMQGSVQQSAKDSMTTK